MERFRMAIAAADDESEIIFLSFQSTAAAEDFPEGAVFSGKELKKALGAVLGKYGRRLKERRGEDFAKRECERISVEVGEYCGKLSDDRKYVVKESRMMLCFCELPFAGKTAREE